MFVTATLAALALISVGVMLWQWWLGMRFPVNRALSSNPSNLGVSILKPLKGCDSHTEECLRSWMGQTASRPVQMLFGVADPRDPVCKMVQRLMEAHPDLDGQLVICPKRMGANAKVSILIQLSRLAKNEILLVSDADVWAPDGVIDQIAASLARPATGVASSLYADVTPANFWMRLETVAINADFWTQVLHARRLNKVDFALGAVMAVHKRTLNEIGGFDSLVDYLADDYQLGRRIAATGATVDLCPTVVECRNDPMTARQVWSHQVRWARTIRVCNPVQYFFSIVGNATLWTTVFAVYAGISRALPKLDLGFRPGPGGYVFVSMTWASLLMIGTLLGRVISALLLQKRLTGRTDHFPWWFLPPLKDVLAVGIWATAFLGNTVQWRGHRYRVHKGGKLTEL